MEFTKRNIKQIRDNTMSKALPDKYVEVVYSPCDDVDTNEIIWRN